MPRRRHPSTKRAPRFEVKDREVIALEHPAIIQNLDNAIKTFGRNNPFERILSCVEPEECVPLYLRFRDPTCVPILSHNSATNNVLLKLTVPKRTGRKRKRGSQEPFKDDTEPVTPLVSNDDRVTPSVVDEGQPAVPSIEDDDPSKRICSQARMDKPASLLRKLQDNVGKYNVEAVGRILQTHRFRGLADFHQSTSHTTFIPKVRDTLLTGDLDKIKEFKFDLSRGWKAGEEILPPPNFSTTSLPFNWGFLQNPHIVEEIDPVTGERILVNLQSSHKIRIQYINCREGDVPSGPEHNREIDDPDVEEVVKALEEALEERPVWSRRALINRISNQRNIHLSKQALPFVGYRFRDGPFRDAIIRHGFDPRVDPKYREYQTIYFQLSSSFVDGPVGTVWHDPRNPMALSEPNRKKTHDQTHMFDGQTLTIDGRVWQLCDITDPLLAKLIKEAPIRETFDPDNDGWYCNGTLAKIKNIMRVKIIALRTGKDLRDEDFARTLETPDIVPGRATKDISLPVPNIKLSAAEIRRLREAGKPLAMMNVGASLSKRSVYVGPLRHAGTRAGEDKLTPNATAEWVAASADAATGGEGRSQGAAARVIGDPEVFEYVDDDHINIWSDEDDFSDRSRESDTDGSDDEEEMEDEEENEDEGDDSDEDEDDFD